MLAILFSITTTYFCLSVAATFKLMIGALIDNTDLELLERFEVANSSILPLNLALRWTSGNGYGSMFIFGDGIVVWRAWAVWSENQSVIILPALTLLATLGMELCFVNVLLIYLNYQATFLAACVIQTIESNFSTIVFGTIAALLTAASALSIATNLIAVLLIGFKAYLIWFSQHWKFMKHTLGVGTSAAGKVLMFLTESGMVYIIFQIINFSLSVVDIKIGTPLDAASDFWSAMMIIFSAAYPNLVILIVYNQHSIARPTEVSTAGSSSTSVTDSIMIRHREILDFKQV
ncbi:hypothetical protein C8J56DRAFT_891730 [Mycena floridula]|nr:hypothetical protein C8J56DRAFT_891730 [Mycena floridula]